MTIDVILTPLEAEKDRLLDKAVAVIDVFRATTCICTALANGAKKVIPLTNVAECVELYEELKPTTEKLLKGGERKMVRLEGFELDNSPLSFTPEVVDGATIIISTTNGTRSIKLAEEHGAKSIVIASMLNGAAAAEALHAVGSDITLFCSGRADRFSMEDTLCAGYMISQLEENHTVELTDVAWWAREVYLLYADNMREAMRHNTHYHRLLDIGHADDVEFALRRDTLTIVPRVKDGTITLNP